MMMPEEVEQDVLLLARLDELLAASEVVGDAHGRAQELAIATVFVVAEIGLDGLLHLLVHEREKAERLARPRHLRLGRGSTPLCVAERVYFNAQNPENCSSSRSASVAPSTSPESGLPS